MRLDDLDEIVDPLVLLRGQDYYRDGRVVALELAGERAFRAEVEGTDRYDIHVEWDSEGEFSCACTCPYDWGPVCKHVIAVLFEIEDAHPEFFTGETIQMPSSKSEQVRAILEGLPRELLVDILAGLAENDRGISLDLRARYGEGAPDKAAYLRMAREALRLGQDRHGFLDYWGASRASHGLDSLLSRAGTLLRGGQADRAVLIAQAVLETTAKAYDNADDSMGTLGDCIRIALSILAEAGHQIGEEHRRELLVYCLALAPVEPYCDYGWGWDLARIAADLIARPEERTRIFALLDTMGERRADESAGLRYQIANGDRETAALIKLSIVEREDGAEEGLLFIQDHIHLHAFRQRLIQHHLERGELVEVKRLCTDWLEEHSSTWFGYRKSYLDTLLEVAQRENDTQAILRLARSLFQNSGDFDYYDLIKEKLPTQEWLEVLHELIEELKAGAKEWFTLAGIYAREDMWVELLEIVLRAGEPMLERYRGVLEPRYPEEVSKAYEGIVYEMLVRTSNRGVYARAAEFLQRMTAMGYGGRVEEIIDDLIVKHRRRRAMIEELEAVRPNKA